MADKEIVRRARVEPDVGFDARAPGGEGVVEGDAAPVVVVGVAWEGIDIPGE